MLRRAQGLPDRGESSVEDPRARQPFDLLQVTCGQAGQYVELVAHEQVEGSLQSLRVAERGVSERAFEIQGVRGAGGRGDAYAGAVDLVDGADRRAGRYEVGRLDLGIGRRERDLGRACGL